MTNITEKKMIEYTKENPLKVVTAFSGYDSQKMALERLHRAFPDFCYELVAWSEIDANAITAHNAVETVQSENGRSFQHLEHIYQRQYARNTRAENGRWLHGR